MKSSEQRHQADQVLMHHTPTWWIAEFRGPIARQMREAAGTDTVQTGFNGHVPAEVVCRAIAILNPDAEVSVAESLASAAARPLPAPQPAAEAPAQPASKPAARTPISDLAAEVVNTFKGDPGPADAGPVPSKEVQTAAHHLERAMKIRSRFGMLVACSYLREKGWSFEEARRFLYEVGQ
jgi:hypothetical protein